MTESNFTPPEVDELNERMPAFQFVSRLASDGSNAVYLVKQKSLDRRAAIKLYSPELSRSPEFRESFAATTKVMAKLKHPNLIGVYDSGLEEDMLYLVMEFVAGKPLWNSTKGQPVHIKHVQTLVEGICVGMCHAHSNNICHGALSLKSILIDETLMPKIGGFSHSPKLDPGAVRFRAPEMAEDGAIATPQSDIYSVGVIMREMAVGQTEGADALADIEKFGPALRQLVLKATSDDPSKRHRKLEDFYEELLDAFDENSSKTSVGARLKMANAQASEASSRANAASAQAKTSAVTLKTAAVQLKTAAVKLPPGKGGSSGSKPATIGSVTASRATNRPKGPAAGPSSLPKPSTPSAPPPKASSPIKLWVHIVVIIVLLVAIKLVHSKLEAKKKANEDAQRKLNTQTEVHVKRTIHRPNTGRPNLHTIPPKPDDTGSDDFPNDPDPVIPEKSTAQEMERLKPDLLKGYRGSMPEGTVEYGKNYYCLIDIPMTWPEAFWFAIEHGGHLAVPGPKATAAWMREKLGGDPRAGFWLGAAKSGRYSWTLADGRAWRPKDTSLSRGDYLAVGSDGQLVALQSDVRRQFVIQWTKDGSNPGSFGALMNITKESMAGAAPIYPPGTRAYGVRHYLYVPANCNWKDAVLSARSSGGHLMVIGGIAEKFNLEKMTKDVGAENGIWLGGFHLAGKGWRWTTGEAWRSSDWPKDKPAKNPDSALLLMPGGAWDERSREEKASGYVIEWSEDHKNAAK